MATALRTILLILVLLVAVTACASRSPSLSSAGDGRGADRDHVAAGGSSSSPDALHPVHDCTKAAKQRGRVPRLLAEGKLHRTLRVIDHANRLCPETATETRLPERQALAEIGRYQSARELADKIFGERTVR